MGLISRVSSRTYRKKKQSNQRWLLKTNNNKKTGLKPDKKNNGKLKRKLLRTKLNFLESGHLLTLSATTSPWPITSTSLAPPPSTSHTTPNVGIKSDSVKPNAQLSNVSSTH